jgi:hypothetical protein
MKTNYNALTLIGFGVIGMIAWTFLAPKILSKPKPVAAPAAPMTATSPSVIPVTSPMGPVIGGMDIPNSDMDIGYDGDVLPNMNFAGVTFAENIPGMSYGFPMAGVV